MTPREKYIAIAVGAAAVLLGVDQLVYEPFHKQSEDVDTRRQAASLKLVEQNQLFDNFRRMRKEWEVMTRSGLTNNPSAAVNQVQRAIGPWSKSAGLARVELAPERASIDSGFDVEAIRVTGYGSMTAAAKFIWAVESSPIPLRVTDLQLGPEKAGSSNLKMMMTVSTLSRRATQENGGGAS